MSSNARVQTEAPEAPRLPPPVPPQGADTKLRIDGLTKIYGRSAAQAIELLRAGSSRDDVQRETRATVAVRDVAFSVGAGETFVVMGLSGSGKSTLIRCLNRLIEPSAGRILVDGADICGFDTARLRELRLRKIAMVFQNVALLPHRTVLENVEFGLKVRGLPRGQRRDAAMAALEQVGLARWATHRPDKLSGGMQQRVGLARGLAVDPDILLMDEPFSALDPLIRNDMQQELLALQNRLRKTIVFITHDLHEALTLGNRIAIMKDGQFVQVGTAIEIVGAPADEYVAAFTSDIDRARVLTVREVMRIPPTGDDSDLRRVRPETRLSEIYDMCATGDAIAVANDDGRVIGILHPLDVFRALAANPGKAPPRPEAGTPIA